MKTSGAKGLHISVRGDVLCPGLKSRAGRGQKIPTISKFVRANATLPAFMVSALPLPPKRRSSTAMSQVIFSGTQPTGVPHLGNYLGALSTWTSLQSTPSTLYLIQHNRPACHHCPLLPTSTAREPWLALYAVGIDFERSVVFEQSSVPGSDISDNCGGGTIIGRHSGRYIAWRLSVGVV
jgi:tRNA synthetases class I (W and Y)